MLILCLLVAFMTSASMPGQAFAIELTSPEGEQYAFPVLHDAEGRTIARSTFSQWFEGGLLHVQLLHELRDGRQTVERARFIHGKELDQQSWSWEERRGDALLRAFEVDLVSGRASARKREGDREKTWQKNVKVERGMTFAGLGIPYAVKNLGKRILRGENVQIRGILFMPRPVSLKFNVKHAARERIGIADRKVDADRFEVRPALFGLEKIAELFKDTPGADVWLHHGRPPMILRIRYPFAGPLDPTVVIHTLGTP